MGYNLKLGKGGHGLEVYDSDGKYADDFSFDIEGTTVSNYDDFRKLYFLQLSQQLGGSYTPEYLEQYYNQDSTFKNQVDEELYAEYNNMLTIAVENHNARQIWDTPEEAAKHLHELFVPSLVQSLIDNNYLNSDYSKITENYEVSTLAACLQMSRYEKNVANKISEQEYEQKSLEGYGILSNYVGSIEDKINFSVEQFKKYIDHVKSVNGYVPINRGIRSSGSDSQTIRESFYSENSPQKSCLSHQGGGYLGSVIYFACGKTSSYSYRNLIIRGLVKIDDNTKMLFCPLTWGEADDEACNSKIPEVIKFRSAIYDNPNFEKNMKEALSMNGQIGSNDVDSMYDKIRTQIFSDPGLCAMLMGYDVLYGCGYQFDILNLGKIEILGE